MDGFEDAMQRCGAVCVGRVENVKQPGSLQPLARLNPLDEVRDLGNHVPDGPSIQASWSCGPQAVRVQVMWFAIEGKQIRVVVTDRGEKHEHLVIAARPG